MDVHCKPYIYYYMRSQTCKQTSQRHFAETLLLFMKCAKKSKKKANNSHSQQNGKYVQLSPACSRWLVPHYFLEVFELQSEPVMYIKLVM